MKQRYCIRELALKDVEEIWLYALSEGRHLIFYMMTDNTVDVIGIPHQSMDITGHLTE